MSVLIKGMKMPKNCLECGIRAYDANAGEEYCPFSQMECLSIGLQKNCPLVEVPESHGRLVDADELWKKMSKYTDNMGAKMPFGDDDSMIHRDSACFMIESADTIIEAEGAEE